MDLSEIRKEVNIWNTNNNNSFSAIWKSPSNIALLKYWGKLEGQIPANPSLSFSLALSYTTTKITAYTEYKNKGILSLNGDSSHVFLKKINKFMHTLLIEIPLFNDFSFEIETSNTFPHSAGIASSASGFSALSLAFLDLAQNIADKKLSNDDFFKYASFLSRLGSGSACRSVYPGYTVWGNNDKYTGSSDYYAIDINKKVHKDFQNLQDTILLVSSEKKVLSSSNGHKLMNDHPYSKARITQAKNNLKLLKKALSEGDFELLSKVSESEALSLHALIMSSEGGSILLEAASIELIKRIRNAQQNGLQMFFTIDAGPNIHLIYPASEKTKIKDFIFNNLYDICDDSKIIFDYCGDGPLKINNNN